MDLKKSRNNKRVNQSEGMDFFLFLESHQSQIQQKIEIKEQKTNHKQFSLTLLTPERGEIPLPYSNGKEAQDKVIPNSSFKKKKAQKIEIKQENGILPCPKFSKLGEITYCVYNANILSIFQYSKGENQNKKKLFEQKRIFRFDFQIKFVRGNNELMLVAFQNEFIIVSLNEVNIFKELVRKSENGRIIGGCFEQQGEFVIVTNTSLTKYIIKQEQIVMLHSYTTNLTFTNIHFIQILKDIKLGKYLLLLSEKKKVSYNTQSKANLQGRELIKDGQVLKVVQLGFQSDEDNQIYEVSNIPKQGMFELSKAYYMEQQSFLLSLFEEIIVVRKQFSRYIVVDNTAIESMNFSDDSKTGQLLLVDKQKVVYNDHQGINVYNLLYLPNQDKIKMQSVDNFSAIDQSQVRLYDGIMLKAGDTNIQVLFYFDNRKIMRPGRKNTFTVQSDEKQEQKSKLRFSIYAIIQSQPIERLIELLKLKRPQSEINEFRMHFNISPLQFYKSQWSVSAKSLNDIINNLLEISDQQFIENELDRVLKKQPMTLNCLIKIEQKQVTRLKRVIISKLDDDSGVQMALFSYLGQQSVINKNKKDIKGQKRQQLIKIIKKLLESKMFLKKLKFLSQFQAYKKIDFIQINKLRQMSLKSQIKLLSSKGYEKRLKQFLNQFKYLAIANFDDIFKFLMENKNQIEAKQFLSKMGFLFPYSSASKQLSDMIQDDRCYIWDDFKNIDEGDKNQGPETIQSFVSDMFSNPNKKFKYLTNIMEQFIQTDWFKNESFKKHCKLSIKYEELVKMFEQLKAIQVYNILYKYLLQKITSKNIRQDIIISFLNAKRLPVGIRANMQIREEVYYYLKSQRLLVPSIKLSEFSILSETDYFKYITIENSTQHLLFQKVKNIYEKVINDNNYKNLELESNQSTIAEQVNNTKSIGFFEQCFEKSMQRVSVPINQLKFYLNQFIILGSEFQRNNQYLLEIILKTINRTLKVTGDVEQILSIAKLYFKIDLLDRNPQLCSVFLEVALFNGFWKNFDLDYFFSDLNLQQSSKTFGQNKIILQAIQKYCKDDFKQTQFDILSLLQSSKQSLQHIIKKVNIRKPTDFFQFILFMTNQIGYSHELALSNLEYFLLQMLKNEKFQQIFQMTTQLSNFIHDKNPTQFLEEVVLKHVKKLYETNVQIQSIYNHAMNSLNLIVPMSIKIKQQKAFLDLCQKIEQLDCRILSQVQNMRLMLTKSALVFMMNIWMASKKQNIAQQDSLKTRMLLENIYQKFKQFNSFDLNFQIKASNEIQFLQFEVERGYTYVERNLIHASLQICKLLANQTKLYFGDLVYSLTCQIAKKLMISQQNGQKQCQRLIEYTVQNDSITEIIVHLQQIITSQHKAQFKLINALNILDMIIAVQMIQNNGIEIKQRVYYQLFFSILQIKPIQAFYFLMKNKKIDILKVIQQLQINQTLKVNRQIVPKHLSLVIYIRSLEQVIEDFFSTYSFFQTKEKQLSSEKMKNDINYLAQKMNNCEVSKYMLNYYNLYMESLSLTGYINLTEIKQQNPKASLIQGEITQMTQSYLKQKQQIESSKKKYQQLMSSILSRPKPVPPMSYQTSRNSSFRVNKTEERIQLPSIKLQKYEQIKRRQLHNLKKVQKQFVQQQTNSNVDKILKMFKQKKQLKLSQLRSKENNISVRDNFKNKQFQIPFESEVVQRSVLRPIVNMNQSVFIMRQNLLKPPITERSEFKRKNIVQKPEKPFSQYDSSFKSSSRSHLSATSNVTDRSLYLQHTKPNNEQSVLNSVNQLKIYLKQNFETQALKYFQRFELIYSNTNLGKQFMKRIFECCKTFDTWIKIIDSVIKYYQPYSEVFEAKAIKLCLQTLKISINIQPNKLFDLSFFEYTVSNSTQQKYHESVFVYLKTNIIKLLDDTNVQALAKAFFYSMGLMRKYQYQIYIYYLDKKLEQYMNTPFNKKQQQYFIDKLRSVYAKLGKDSKDNTIKQLFRNKINTKGGQKIKNLIKLIDQSITFTSKVRSESTEDQSLIRVLKSI